MSQSINRYNRRHRKVTNISWIDKNLFHNDMAQDYFKQLLETMSKYSTEEINYENICSLAIQIFDEVGSPELKEFIKEFFNTPFDQYSCIPEFMVDNQTKTLELKVPSVTNRQANMPVFICIDQLAARQPMEKDDDYLDALFNMMFKCSKIQQLFNSVR